MSTPYGFCPTCGAPGKTRERRPNGNDTCSAGHSYPSRDALSERPTSASSGLVNKPINEAA